MLCLPGSPAHSEFRLKKQQQQLAAAGITVNGLSSRFIHLVHTSDGDLDEAQLKVLQNLLTYGPALDSANVDGKEFYVVPRPGTISPWASKATDIAHNCGLDQVKRIERGILYTVATGRALHGARDILSGHTFALPQAFKNGVMIWNPALEGYSHREIAEQLGISEGASKSQLSKARKMLRTKIQKEEISHEQRIY